MRDAPLGGSLAAARSSRIEPKLGHLTKCGCFIQLPFARLCKTNPQQLGADGKIKTAHSTAGSKARLDGGCNHNVMYTF